MFLRTKKEESAMEKMRFHSEWSRGDLASLNLYWLMKWIKAKNAVRFSFVPL